MKGSTVDKRIRVQVTEDDIMAGIRQSSVNCMVARALKRAHPEAERVMVDIQTIRFTDADGKRRLWLTPFPTQDLIVAFDAGEFSKLHPVVFQLQRKNAHRIHRQVPKTPADGAKRNTARRKGESQAGAKTVRTPGLRPAKRSPATTQRSYGRRAIHVNQARARAGDIPAKPEPVPE